MSPKSRLYTLVKAWKNKPFQEVRDVCGEAWPELSNETLNEHQSWVKRQAISHEPIFNLQGTKLKGSLYRPLLSGNKTQLLRLFMEGLDAITYWYRSGRFISGVLPMPAYALESSTCVDALSDLILNSRLPVGLINLGVQDFPKIAAEDICMGNLLRMRRLGVLIHQMQFMGTDSEIRWIKKLQPEAVHIDVTQLRNEAIPTKVLDLLKQMSCQLYAGNITFVKDLENASALHIDYAYGGLMMPPVSQHQTLHISDSRIAKAIFSLHPQKNQNGDK
jgi:hypothetical protein